MLFDTSKENNPTSLTDYIDQLNTYTNRIAGGRGVSKPVEEIWSTREEGKSNPSIVTTFNSFFGISGSFKFKPIELINIIYDKIIKTIIKIFSKYFKSI